jgi:hypothetical protein
MNPFNLALIITALSFGTWAFAGPGDAGGGAGITVGGKFYTLAQAGLKIDPKAERYFPDQQTLAASMVLLKDIESILPDGYKHSVRNAAFGNQHQFERLLVADPASYNKIKSEYQKYINMTPLKGEFKLIGFTKNKVTYLLPDWDTTPPEARALFLVTHESAYFHKTNQSLEAILRFESAVLNLHQSPADPDRMMAVYDSLWELNFISLDLVIPFYVYTLGLKGISITLDAFFEFSKGEGCLVEGTGGAPQADLHTSPLAISAHRSVDPQFFSRFYRTSFKFFGWSNVLVYGTAVGTCSGIKFSDLRLSFDPSGGYRSISLLKPDGTKIKTYIDQIVGI